MTPDPARRGATESGNTLLGSNQFPDTTTASEYQGPSSDRRSGVRHLRLVPPSPPPRPGGLEVRFHVFDGRAPFGLAGPFRLSESDVDELIAIAVRMERRRA
jgi:hypothetical protein